MAQKWPHMDVPQDRAAVWIREFTSSEEWINPPYTSEKPLRGVSGVFGSLALPNEVSNTRVLECFKHLKLGNQARLRAVAAKEAACAYYLQDQLAGFDMRPDMNGKTARAWIEAAVALGQATAQLSSEDRIRLQQFAELPVPDVDEDEHSTSPPITPSEVESLAYRVIWAGGLILFAIDEEGQPGPGRPKKIAGRRLVYRLGLIWREFGGSFSNPRGQPCPWYEFVGTVMRPLTHSSHKRAAIEVAKLFRATHETHSKQP